MSDFLDEISENKESKLGVWEYVRQPKKDEVSFQYWKEDDGKPSVEIKITLKEFNDLIEFMKKIKPLK